jgi:HTH-type transcriptional regulator/antitoxin HipB
MGRHRDPGFERLRQGEQLAVEAALRVRDRRRTARDLVERVRPQINRTAGAADPAALDEDVMAVLFSQLRGQVSAALRSGRAERALSQRDLAAALGMSQSALARLESEAGECSLAAVVRALAAVGTRLTVLMPDSAERPRRMVGEHARDRSGRRLPAHLAPYRLAQPHEWWVGNTDARMWSDEPRWSYRRRPA